MGSGIAPGVGSGASALASARGAHKWVPDKDRISTRISQDKLTHGRGNIQKKKIEDSENKNSSNGEEE